MIRFWSVLGDFFEELLQIVISCMIADFIPLINEEIVQTSN